MHYLALGDSISIDDYTGVPNGGAASQFARLIGATHFQDLTRDGHTTGDVVESLIDVIEPPDVVTLTAGGNDFLQGAFEIVRDPGRATWAGCLRDTLDNLCRIADHLDLFECLVIFNTIYDPTDGDNALLAQFGVGPVARIAYNALNDGIRILARQRGYLFSDLQTLFHGHGAVAHDTWIVGQIEPNHAGATAIADHWHSLFSEYSYDDSW